MNEETRIYEYLLGKMSVQEKKHFELTMENDPSLKEMVLFEKELLESLNPEDWHQIQKAEGKEFQELRAVFRSEKIQKARKHLSEAMERNRHITPQKESKKFFLLKIAAIVIIGLGVFGLWNPFSSEKPSEIYATYLEKSMPASLLTRAGEDTSLEKAATLFNQKSYAEACTILTQIIQENEKPSASLYIHLGIAQMESKDYTAAAKTFAQLKPEVYVDAEKKHWYLGLLAIKQNQMAIAKEQLGILVQKKGFKHQEAQEILAKLP